MEEKLLERGSGGEEGGGDGRQEIAGQIQD